MSKADRGLRRLVNIHLVINREFRDYSENVKSFRRRNIENEILNRALTQDEVNFYDLGCGFGYASLDFFEVLEKQAKKRKLPMRLLDNINYIGIDQFVTEQVPVRDERIRFISPLDLRTLDSSLLPSMDVGVSFFVFPYIDKKLETINNLYSLLRKGDNDYSPGEAIITHYFYNQIKQVEKGTSRDEMRFFKHLPNFDLSSLVIGDPKVLRWRNDSIYLLGKEDTQIGSWPRYYTSKAEEILWTKRGPKGQRAGQRISLYRTAA